MAYGAFPGRSVDLLITPHESTPATRVAELIHRELKRYRLNRPDRSLAYISPLEGILAARLYFDELIHIVLPLTGWFVAEAIAQDIDEDGPIGPVHALLEILSHTSTEGLHPDPGAQARRATAKRVDERVRFWTLIGLLHWAATQNDDEKVLGIDDLQRLDAGAIAQAVKSLWRSEQQDAPKSESREEAGPGPLVWLITLNRAAYAALTQSVAAVKADAAKRLFNIDCSEIAWAVIDSGIDAAHPAFVDHKSGGARSRIVQSYDFTVLREIRNLDALTSPLERDRLVKRLVPQSSLDESTIRSRLEAMAADTEAGRPFDWENLEPLIRLPKYAPPQTDHGTHVAGILAADWRDQDGRIRLQGVCPDIKLYDLRVLAETEEQTEFAIVGALDFVRWLNQRNRFVSIHGVNLSLSIPHVVENYACGRTPVCEACERLVSSGVVVVAAAGNHGHRTMLTTEGNLAGYQFASITDPGNAEGVICVGATHRYRPHTYGVSFFSSRGPTGDGRVKPDLVAPGEKIDAPIPGGRSARMDGTSMAAPHVSGAAALLMARFPEFRGNASRVKKVLCDSATDLGRESYFQGRGMLDVLRALQSI
jgi:hypothetical protein